MAHSSEKLINVQYDFRQVRVPINRSYLSNKFLVVTYVLLYGSLCTNQLPVVSETKGEPRAAYDVGTREHHRFRQSSVARV